MEGNWGIALFFLIIGAIIGGASQAVLGRYAAFRESQGIAEALRSEIETILMLVDQRGYLNVLNAAIVPLQNPAYQPTYHNVISISITQDYFTDFNSVCPKIGLLGDVGGRITRFYSVAKALIEDVNEFREIHKQAMTGLVTVFRQPLLTRYLEMVGLLQMMQIEGSQALNELSHHSCQWFLWREKFRE